MFREVGVILDGNYNPVSWSLGEPASVVFDLNILWALHRNTPQYWHFIHVHPEGLIDISHEDETTMRALAMALAPYRFDFDVITKKSWVSYTVQLEPIENFKMRRATEDPKAERKVVTTKQFTVERNHNIETFFLYNPFNLKTDPKEDANVWDRQDIHHPFNLFRTMITLSTGGIE